MGWSKWIDLAMPADTMASMPFDLPAPAGPRYPYGMRITLDNQTLEAMDLELKDIVNGAEIDMRAFGHVVAFSNEDGRCSVSLQLTRIKIEAEDDEDTESEEDD